VIQPVRYSAGLARVRARLGELWDSSDSALLLRSGIDRTGRRLSDDFRTLYPPLVAWYAMLLRAYPRASPLWRALLRLHEVENLKLLWRAAVRGRTPYQAAWRPLGPLAALAGSDRKRSPDELAAALADTPYAEAAASMFHASGGNAALAEVALDRWAWLGVSRAALDFPGGEADARQLVRLLTLEHDAELLRRGRAAGLDADLVAKSTVTLASECRVDALLPAAAWTPGAGALAGALPRPLRRIAPSASGWDDVLLALRRARRAACRRAFVGWPYQVAPALAGLLLREEQVRDSLRLAATRTARAPAHALLPIATAAGVLEG
jgi:hypothetical protein